MVITVLTALEDKSGLGPNLSMILITLLYSGIINIVMVIPFTVFIKRQLKNKEIKTSKNKSNSPPIGGAVYEKPQSGYTLCGFSPPQTSHIAGTLGEIGVVFSYKYSNNHICYF